MKFEGLKGGIGAIQQIRVFGVDIGESTPAYSSGDL